MNSKIKMFVFLVALGFGSSMLFTMIWENYGDCIENGMMPDFTDKNNCIELGTPSAFGAVAEGKPIWETGSDKVCGDKLCSEVDESEKKSRYSIAYHPPPLKQIESGTLPSNVTCTEGLSIVYKQSTGMPACVKAKTAERLAERGWTVKLVISSFDECVKAGNPVMESYPRQCRTIDGQHFVEDIEIISENIVTQIVDGDTIKVNGKSIRFALASAPELFESGGIESRSLIANICPVGSTVVIDEDDGQLEGSYGRIIAVIHCNGLNLNAELLDSGLGYLDTRFCDESEFANDNWAQKHGCKILIESSLPQVQSETISNQLQVSCDSSYPDVCIPSYPPDLDCSEISHRNFKVLQPDPHRFDGDKDGISCES